MNSSDAGAATGLPSRRQFLRGALAWGLAAAGLAAAGCQTEPGAGRTQTPSSAGPRRGGTFSGLAAADPPSLDPYVSGSQGQAEFSAYSYSRLFMLKAGPNVPRGSLEVVPDAAESVEVSPDGLTYTVRLRKNVAFHPPLDRAMTAEDVVFSWNRLTGRLPGSTPSVRAEDIQMVDAVAAADQYTVVFRLKNPYPFFLQKLADPKVFFIMPKETGTAFNPAEKVVGSGPWFLQEFVPGKLARFKRHPNWHLGPEIPYMDEVVVNVVPEYATQLSQFLRGNLDWVVVQGPDLKRVVDTVRGAQIYERPPYPLSVLNFSPREARWEDQRLRWAVSLALDRDAMLDAAYGLKELENQGFKVNRYWHTHIPAAFSEYWVDPKGPEMEPEAARYLKYNPEEARRLVQEAGGSFSTELHFAAANSRYGEPYRVMSELIVQYLGRVGINVRAVEEDYNSVFIPQTARGEFNGLMWIPQTRVDPFAYLETQYLITTNKIYGRWNDAQLRDRVRQIQTMVDPDRLRREIRGIHNELLKKMYVVPMPYGAGLTFTAYQPWVRNAVEYQTFGQGWPSECLPYYWLDR